MDTKDKYRPDQGNQVHNLQLTLNITLDAGIAIVKTCSTSAASRVTGRTKWTGRSDVWATCANPRHVVIGGTLIAYKDTSTGIPRNEVEVRVRTR